MDYNPPNLKKFDKSNQDPNKKKKLKTLIMEREEAIKDALIYSLDYFFSFEYFYAKTVEEAISIVNNAAIDLIVSEMLLLDDDFGKLNFYLDEKDLKIPYFLIGPKQFSNFPDFEGPSKIGSAEKNEVVKNLNEVLLTTFGGSLKSLENSFCAASINELKKSEKISNDVFIKLPNGRYLKIMRSGDDFNENDLHKYKNKGVIYLYHMTETKKWLLEKLDNEVKEIVKNLRTPEFNKKISEARSRKSPSIGPTPTLTNTNKMSNVVVKEKKTQENHGKIILKEDHSKKEKTIPQVEKVETKKNTLKDIENEVKNALNLKLKVIIKLLKQTPPLQKYVIGLKVKKSIEAYNTERTMVLCNVLYGLFRLMDWKNESTLEKLISAALVHDLFLTTMPHLLIIKSTEYMEKQNIILKEEEKNIYYNHPTDMANLLRRLRSEGMDIKTEIEEIVEMKQELPDGTGFPKKLGVKEISLNAAVFIVGIDLTHFIFTTPKKFTWDLYYKHASRIYRGGHFSQILTAFRKIL